MSSVKAQLKSIADLVKQSKWDDVIQKANDLLEREPRNHQGYMSLYLSLLGCLGSSTSPLN